MTTTELFTTLRPRASTAPRRAALALARMLAEYATRREASAREARRRRLALERQWRRREQAFEAWLELTPPR